MVEGMHRLLKSVMSDRIELVIALHSQWALLAELAQIEQVILNLVLNARDAMPSGGTLTLETKDVTLGAHDDSALAPGNYVALVVTDTGTGIADGVLPHIFEPFFTTKDIGQRTGLGLSTVEGIVRQSGGAVRVESRLGHGTTFTILLPQAQSIPSPPLHVGEEDAPRRINFETILVCDDDDEVRELLADVLGLRAYTILKAKNGHEAIEVARSHPGPIHLLLTAIAMPGLGGIELAAELRERDPKLRVLYMSGYAEDTGRLPRDLDPGTHLLAKPFLPSDLTKLAFSILEGRVQSEGY
jgi:CheY-like chemotaxis protein